MKQEDKKTDQERDFLKKKIRDEQKNLASLIKRLISAEANNEAMLVKKSAEYLNRAMRSL